MQRNSGPTAGRRAQAAAMRRRTMVTIRLSDNDALCSGSSVGSARSY